MYMTYIVFYTAWMYVAFPKPHIYKCELKEIEHTLCRYKCYNDTNTFRWLEPMDNGGCKIRKIYFKT